LLRADGSKAAIDLHTLFDGDPNQNLNVAGGDTLFVPRAPQFYLYGEVQHPGPYRLERNMTITQGIALGGGLTAKGSEHRMKITRRGSDGAVKVVSVTGRDLLQPDDVLSIKESWF
jgi:polysaccharide biosynthesis/export protein